jgi:HK97 family phage portal protein
VFACVRLLADTAASLPLIAYRDTPQGRVKATGRLASLLANPAPGITQADLVGTLVGHLNVWGNAYLGKYRSSDSIPVEQIAPIHPATITVALVKGQPQYTLVRPDGVSQHDSSDILHIKALSLDGLLGLSPIQLCRNTLSLANSLGQHATTFAQNAGRVGGVLRIPGWRTAQPGAAEQVREDWESRFTGAAQSGKLLLLAGEDEVTYTQLALNMVDAQFVEQVQMSLQEICRIFRVPPHLIAVSTGERLTYSNVEMEAAEFLKFSLSPWLVRVEQALSSDPDLSPATQGCRFAVDELLRADTATRAQLYTAALNPDTGWMTRDEVRALENLPLEGQ